MNSPSSANSTPAGPPPHIGNISMPGPAAKSSPYTISSITGSSKGPISSSYRPFGSSAPTPSFSSIILSNDPPGSQPPPNSASSRSVTLQSDSSQAVRSQQPVQKNLQAFGFAPKRANTKSGPAGIAGITSTSKPFMGSLGTASLDEQSIAAHIAAGIEAGFRSTGSSQVPASLKSPLKTPVVVKGSIGNPFSIATNALSAVPPNMGLERALVPSDPRIVISPINAEALGASLRYFNLLDEWSHIVHGVAYGFDVGFISDYITQEQAAGRFSQSYTPDELQALIGPFRTSPLGLVPKAGSDSFCLVQDLSYPRNSDTPSVNSLLNSDDFPTEWGTFTDATNLILSLPAGCEAATFDISAAYRITPVLPTQQNSLCLYWQGRVIVDRAVCFGLATSAGVFGSIADMLAAIYRKWGVRGLLKWVDDFFAIRFPDQSWTEEEFIALTAAFGIPWSVKKTRRFSRIQQYIGFVWDLGRKVVSLPPGKLNAIVVLMKEWRVAGGHFSASNALSLQGKLIHISCIYPLIRPFIASAGFFARSFRSVHAKLGVPSHLDADLSWILWLLEVLPNEMPLASSTPFDLGIWGDASSSYGIAIVIDCYWAVWTWAPGFKIGPKHRYDIGWAEAVAVELALCGQFGSCRLFKERKVKEPRRKHHFEGNLYPACPKFIFNGARTCRFQQQHIRPSLARENHGVSGKISTHQHSVVNPSPVTSYRQTDSCITIYPVVSACRIAPPTVPGSVRVIEEIPLLTLLPSPLRPACAASERMFEWKGVNVPPNPVLNIPVLRHIHLLASTHSLDDPGSVGSALRKFHLFCDIFSVAEKDQLPASPALLHSFALWASTDPDPDDPAFPLDIPWESVATSTVSKYLSGIRAWHLAQGWPPPLSDMNVTSIRFSLRGLAKIQGARRSKPPRPPITISFNKEYIRLDLPKAKTSEPGKSQSVFMPTGGDLCPAKALSNLERVVPASPSDPLFSWRDRLGAVRPLVRKAALSRVNEVLASAGWGNAFGHSFRIGGASYLLGQGISPEIVRIAGRWKSLAYELYIRSFQNILSKHFVDVVV
ncbi:hypothetical protein D9757_010604 [Collybiopsis confluens]|uniref:Reverse transcriptase domain-containing protein n=1 Tax=Collybiopsis confluens TaxID=2823264 RepID=A0A8H5GVU4_9AGAR|nr:hypothetical protein D9757_010604 [Collybiopsis confluens]